MSDFGCEGCGSENLGVFVQHGSYFTRCLDCGASGWATSWLAVSEGMSSPVRAAVVDAQLREVESLGEGTAREMVPKITQAAYEGKLVRFLGLRSEA